MQVSNCCGAEFYELETQICKCCNEHADVIEQDKPSIEILDIDKEYNFQAYRAGVIVSMVQKYGTKDNAIFEMEAKVASLKVEADALREMADWEDDE